MLLKCKYCGQILTDGDEVFGIVQGVVVPTLEDAEIDVTKPIIYMHKSCYIDDPNYLCFESSDTRL